MEHGHLSNPERAEPPYEVFGFVETLELQHQRHKAVVALASGDIQPAVHYRLAAELIVKAHEGEARQRAEIGMLLVIAGIRRDAHKLGDYADDLRDAFLYAHHAGFDDIADAIEVELGRLGH